MILITILAAALLPVSPAQDAYAPLRLYDGTWTVTMHDASSGKTNTDSLMNTCSLLKPFYVCQQTVNGKAGALVIFVPDAPGHYYTQNVQPEGWATGRGELTIEGDHWTYMGHSDDNGKTTWYRTANDFTGPDRIHFESAQSPDGKTWTITRSGDEVRGGGH
jgi:hypothetical protein